MGSAADVRNGMVLRAWHQRRENEPDLRRRRRDLFWFCNSFVENAVHVFQAPHTDSTK